MRTTALAEDSAVARMVRLVEDAQNQHSHTEQIVEKIAKYYTPSRPQIFCVDFLLACRPILIPAEATRKKNILPN